MVIYLTYNIYIESGFISDYENVFLKTENALYKIVNTNLKVI